jgi:hypothetical protein
MRRELILKAANTVREALQAAQIRDLLRALRTAESTEGENRTQRILSAYSEFMRHYEAFSAEEKDVFAFLGLGALSGNGFWAGLLEGGQSLDRKQFADIEVAIYNAVFVTPQLQGLLTRETDADAFTIADGQTVDREIKCLRIFVASEKRSLTSPSTIVTVFRAMDKLYEALSQLFGERGIGLAVGSIDSGSDKTFDFFGTGAIIDEISVLLLEVWDRVKYCDQESLQYQIGVAMGSTRFARRANKLLPDSDATHDKLAVVTKCVEMLFCSGAYTKEMDEPRGVRASEVLGNKTASAQLELGMVEDARDEELAPLEAHSRPAGASIAGIVPAIAVMLPNRPA